MLNTFRAYKDDFKFISTIPEVVLWNLENLMGTRSCFGFEEYLSLDDFWFDTLAFGIPDFSCLPASSDIGTKKISAALKKAVRIYEPRLLNSDVSFLASNELKREMRFALHGSLVTKKSEDFFVTLVLRLIVGDVVVNGS
jgi:type VI secretion system lysozyme-like protein